MERSRLLIAIAAMAQPSDSEDDGHFHVLTSLGFDEGEAIRLMSFVPIALSRPVLEGLGVTNFSKLASVPLPNGEWLDILLADQPEYNAALKLAREHVINALIPSDEFDRIVWRSADMAAVRQALDEDMDIRGATIATAFHDKTLAKFVVA